MGGVFWGGGWMVYDWLICVGWWCGVCGVDCKVEIYGL